MIESKTLSWKKLLYLNYKKETKRRRGGVPAVILDSGGKMKKTIVLLAGYPATGKSYLCNKILEKLPEFLVVSQDDMKEQLFDQYGFDNM